MRTSGSKHNCPLSCERYRQKVLSYVPIVESELKKSEIYHQPKGINVKDATLLSSMLRTTNASMYFESGTRNAASTTFISHLHPNLFLLSVDLGWAERFGGQDTIELLRHSYHRLRRLKNRKVEFLVGDGGEEIPKFLNYFQVRNAGIFLDQPKGRRAVRLCDYIIRNDYAKACAIHDVELPCCRYKSVNLNRHMRHICVLQHAEGINLTQLTGTPSHGSLATLVSKRYCY